MKNIAIIFYTLLLISSGINLQGIEPGQDTVQRPLEYQQTDHQLSDDQKNNAYKQAQKQIISDAKTGKATPAKYQAKINELNSLQRPLQIAEAQELAINQFSLQIVGDQTNQPIQSDIILNEDVSPQTPSNPIEIVEATQQAKTVTDSFSLRAYINSMIEAIFGKNSNDPNVVQAAKIAQEEAESKPWFSPWDESVFCEWYKKTMDKLTLIKKSLSSISLFPSTGMNENFYIPGDKEEQMSFNVKVYDGSSNFGDYLTGDYLAGKETAK